MAKRARSAADAKSETIAGCFLLILFGLLWLGWACLYAFALLMETDGAGSWNLGIWSIVVVTYVAGPLALFAGLIAVIRLDDAV